METDRLIGDNGNIDFLEPKKSGKERKERRREGKQAPVIHSSSSSLASVKETRNKEREREREEEKRRRGEKAVSLVVFE